MPPRSLIPLAVDLAEDTGADQEQRTGVGHLQRVPQLLEAFGEVPGPDLARVLEFALDTVPSHLAHAERLLERLHQPAAGDHADEVGALQ